MAEERHVRIAADSPHLMGTRSSRSIGLELVEAGRAIVVDMAVGMVEEGHLGSIACREAGLQHS